MSRDDLVEVPEYALGEERIAFGLTAPQLGILVGAALLAAALNLLPLWAPAKLLFIVLVAGPAAAAAVLPIRGEPAYRWLLRAVRYWRAPKVWRPVVVDETATAEDAGKRPVSGDMEDGPMPVDVGGPVRGVNASSTAEAGAVESGPDNGGAAARTPAAGGPSGAEEREGMDGKVVRLHPEQPDLTEDDSDQAALGEQQPASPPLPYVFPIPRLVCLLSFAGGVGKTTLAVELATYLAAKARYRDPDERAHAVEVLLVDASRLAPAVGLRLGLSPRTLSEAWRWVDRHDAGAVAATIRPVRDHLSLLSLAPAANYLAAEPSWLPEAEFTPGAAAAVIDAARRAGSVLAIADLGTRIEAGHARLIDEAQLVVGVVRPTVESLPDLYRLSEWLRRAGAGNRLAFVANQCADAAEAASIAREVGAPLLAALPVSPAAAAAGERGDAGWPHDAAFAAGLDRLATALWPLGTAGAERLGLARLALHRLGGMLRRSG